MDGGTTPVPRSPVCSAKTVAANQEPLICGLRSTETDSDSIGWTASLKTSIREAKITTDFCETLETIDHGSRSAVIITVA